MSLAQLQAASAYLVRFPERGRGGDWSAFAHNYELTDEELMNLYHVAHCGQVVKYGKKLRRFRFVDVAEALPAPERILGEQLFEQLWFDYFEPVAADIPAEDLPYEFLRFLNENVTARHLIAKQAPPHAPDFLRFLYNEESLRHRAQEWLARPLPEGSVLAHHAVIPMALNYNVPQEIQEPSDNGYRDAILGTTPYYYVLLLKKSEVEPSLFAIDREVYEFLVAQLTEPRNSPARPALYADFVRVGLCHP